MTRTPRASVLPSFFFKMYLEEDSYSREIKSKINIIVTASVTGRHCCYRLMNYHCYMTPIAGIQIIL